VHAGQAGAPGRFPGAESTQIYEGTNQIQRVVMARQLLKYPESRRLRWFAGVCRAAPRPCASVCGPAVAGLVADGTPVVSGWSPSIRNVMLDRADPWAIMVCTSSRVARTSATGC
jgi:hypothetical protein